MTENYELGETREEATSKILDLLEECGSASKFIWFREIHRITDIDKGLLRNILNELKKSKEINVIHGDNKRIFYCLKKYYKKCYDARLKFKDKPIILKDGNKVIAYQNTNKHQDRTRKRLEKQKKKRHLKAHASKKNKKRLYKY